MSILNPTPQETEDDTYVKKLTESLSDTMSDYLTKFKEQNKQKMEYEQKITAGKMLEQSIDEYVKSKQRTFVVAGNYAEYADWIERKGYSRTEYIYVYNVTNIRGISAEDLKGIYIGSWRRRADINELQQQISIIKSKPTWAGPVTGQIVTSVGTGSNGVEIYYDGQSYPISINGIIGSTISGSSSSIGGNQATIEEILRDEVRSKIRVDLRNKFQHEIKKLTTINDVQQDIVLSKIDQILDEY